MPSRNKRLKKAAQKKRKQQENASVKNRQQQKELAQRYGEFQQKDDMPGQTWQRKKLCVETECFGCVRPSTTFCKSSCNCRGKPALLNCLCAPIFCNACIHKHINLTGDFCDCGCNWVYFECPTCREVMKTDQEQYLDECSRVQ